MTIGESWQLKMLSSSLNYQDPLESSVSANTPNSPTARHSSHMNRKKKKKGIFLSPKLGYVPDHKKNYTG